MKPSSVITLYTDGACKGNGKADAIGGWGVYSHDLALELCGGEKATTNNRMELTGAIEAIKYIAENRAISNMCATTTYIICSDSNYVVKGVTEWMQGWIRKNWVDVKNTDLWKELNSLISTINATIEWQWVKGHALSEGNNKADELANKGALGLTLQTEIVQEYIDKDSFINHIKSDVIVNCIGVQKDEVIDKMYDYFISGKYSLKNNNYIDSAYLIFATMSMMKNNI